MDIQLAFILLLISLCFFLLVRKNIITKKFTDFLINNKGPEIDFIESGDLSVLPGVVLMIAMSATGLAGGAALTAALAALGPFGMIGGIVLLATIGLLADKIAELGYEEVTKLVLKEHLKTSSKEEAIELVKKYPITKSMKLKIIDYIENFNEN